MLQMFKYRFKSIISDKSLVFWTLLFPMILSVFFNFALRDAYNVDKVTSFEVGVVDVQDESAQTFLKTLEEEHELIKPTIYTSKEDAVTALKSEDIRAIVAFDTDFSLTIRDNDPMISVLNNIFNTYNTKQAIIKTTLETNPQAITPEFLDELVNTQSFTKAKTDDKLEDLFVIHFYTTIAMLCIYAANWGQKSGEYLQADTSALGIRTNVSPTPKLKLLLLDISVVFLIFVIEYIIHTSFLRFVMNVPFGNNLLLFFGTGLAGGLLSIMLGYVISVFVTGDSEKRTTLISGLGVFSSFLSGMMSIDIKFLLEKYVPFINKINPATLITDNFRYLTLSGYDNTIILNIGIMLLMTFVLGICAYQKLKVVSYDHI